MRNRKLIAMIVSLVLVMALAINGTFAWLNAKTDPVTNTFKAGQITTTVDETIDQSGVKKDVKIKNDTTDGNGVDAYIRAQVIVTWQNENGDVYATAPVEKTDYKIIWSGTAENGGWFEADGVYYHKAPVAPGNSTSVLFTDCKLKDGVTPPAGYYLCVEIISSAIQTVPTTVVETEWPAVKVDDGKLVSNGN